MQKGAHLISQFLIPIRRGTSSTQYWISGQAKPGKQTKKRTGEVSTKTVAIPFRKQEPTVYREPELAGRAFATLFAGTASGGRVAELRGLHVRVCG